MQTRKDEEALKEGGGGNSKYIGRTGIYPVTILGAFISEGRNGSVSVDFFVDHEGQNQTVYGNLRVFNNDGSDNEIGQGTFNKLQVLAGLDSVSDPVDGELPIGKAGADKDVPVLEDFNDFECQIHVQMEYGIYNGSYTEKTVIKGFYGADGASAAEFVKGEDIGKSLAFVTENYGENVTYNDGTDPEVIKEWIKAKRPKNTAKSGGASTPAAGGAAKPSFNKPKRNFGKK